MELDFYLSEMSVSDQHGGGLTLQRVVGDDLMKITHFAYVSRFASDLPPNEQFTDRSINLTTIWESDAVRSIIGRTLAYKINKDSSIIRGAAKKFAGVLDSKFEKNKLITGLVCPQALSSIYTLEELKKRRPVKYISWVMDDHLVQYVNGEWTYPKGVEQVFKKHLQEADQVFVISPTMQAFYKDKFGVESTILFGPAGFADKLETPDFNKDATLKLGYFGTVAAWQTDALAAVAKTLDGINAQLHIYSGIENLPAELNVPGVYLKGKLEPGEVMATMRNYNALLLPISFHEEERNMSEFNIATKMSEYLASGIPIIAVGPSYAAMIKYLKANNAAILVESTTTVDIHNAFKAVQDQKMMQVILQNAKALVVNETATASMQKRWGDAFNKLSS